MHPKQQTVCHHTVLMHVSCLCSHFNFKHAAAAQQPLRHGRHWTREAG